MRELNLLHLAIISNAFLTIHQPKSFVVFCIWYNLIVNQFKVLSAPAPSRLSSLLWGFAVALCNRPRSGWLPKGDVSLEPPRGVPLVELLSLTLLIGFKILAPLRHIKKNFLLCGWRGAAYLPIKFFWCLKLSLKYLIF